MFVIANSLLRQPLGSGTIQAIGSSLRDLGGRMMRELRLRRAIRDVQELDDAMLQDLGLTRDAAEFAVRHGRDGQRNLCF
jgi:uncharacterized protein YjiS (DUF1127 family)